ncbi:MAG: aldehyde-activating protein [Myxococcales bacterium]|nr:aldehyde-activating protein [Myxococcales bacterium]
MDLAKGTVRCNCRGCTKRGWWMARTGPDAVEILAGEDHVSEAPANPYFQRRTCSACHVTLFGTVRAPEAGGPGTNVNVRLLDDVTLEGVSVTWLDGLSDTWEVLGTVPHVPVDPRPRRSS